MAWSITREEFRFFTMLFATVGFGVTIAVWLMSTTRYIDAWWVLAMLEGTIWVMSGSFWD